MRGESRSVTLVSESLLKFGRAVAEKVWAAPVAPEANDHRPTISGSVRGSGVWVGARKLEGELDVGGRRIL